ncbi:hypothetical protein FACS1894190_06740 [Spirochaetia bacterium]|nr:hypothetical protein FACS1894190_06740 [Spirochaetia bacterium]
MKKIAVFVEGQTEQIFITKLIKEFFDEKKLKIISHDMRKLYHNIRIDTFTTDTIKEYYFVIYDCGGDEKVKTDIIDNFPKLQKLNFSFIIGICDLFNPQRKRIIDEEKYKKGINLGLPKTIPAKIILAVKETEAWFIAEEKHYPAISQNLTLSIVNSMVGFDVQKESTEQIPHPMVMLDKIYQAGNTKYSKNKYVVERTVEALDYDNLYLQVRTRNNSLNELFTCLDGLIP